MADPGPDPGIVRDLHPRHASISWPGPTPASARAACSAHYLGERPYRSVRHDAAAADIDACCGERAVRILGGGSDPNGGAGLELALVADLITHDRHLRRHDDLLLAVLVFHGDHRAVDAADGLADGAIGHGAVWRAGPP